MYLEKEQSFYSEREDYGNGYRKKYLDGLTALIDRRREECEKNRDLFGKQIGENREEYRTRFIEMLGWPLNTTPKPVLRVIKNLVYENETMLVTRLQFEVFENFWFYGLLFQQKKECPLPLIISQHGGHGTPEMCSGFFDSENYNDMTMRLANKGVHVFAPQLLLWKKDRFGPATQRLEYDLLLKQVGGSIAALEIYCIQRCLDYFEQELPVKNFGMVGLSYGGFYTLYTAAVETRIQASLACGHFNDRVKYYSADMVWQNSAEYFLDAEVGALVCPRFLRIEVGDNDELFDSVTAELEIERLEKYYASYSDKLEFQVFKGVHEFCPDNQGICRIIEILKQI